MNQKGKESRSRIYDKATKTWFQVPHEVSRMYYRWCNNIRKREQSQHMCFCPQNKWWLCDAMCDDCEFHSKTRIMSINTSVTDKKGKEVPLLEAITEVAMDAGEIVLSKIRSEQILKRLNELMPEAIEIGKLRLLGYHDDEIAETIGLNRTTFRSRLEAVRKRMREEFGDDFEF